MAHESQRHTALWGLAGRTLNAFAGVGGAAQCEAAGTRVCGGDGEGGGGGGGSVKAGGGGGGSRERRLGTGFADKRGREVWL